MNPIKCWNNESSTGKLGIFSLGCENVEVFIDLQGSDGAAYLNPEDRMARIRIGMDCPWPEVVDTVLHEAFEFLFSRRGYAWSQDPRGSFNSDRYMFVFDHSQFGGLCAQVSAFLTNVLPPLQEAYDKLPELKEFSKSGHRQWDAEFTLKEETKS